LLLRLGLVLDREMAFDGLAPRRGAEDLPT
jgi:hypothetical protein